MENIVLVGYGGHALALIEIIISMKKNVIDYFDKKKSVDDLYNLIYRGDEDVLQDAEKSTFRLFHPSIGNNNQRSKVYLKCTAWGWRAPALVHPAAIVSSKVEFPEAVSVFPGTIVETGAVIETGCILNNRSVISHGVRIGSFSHIGPGAILCGDVQVGSQVFIGAGAIIKEGITIGERAIIGAGTIVLNNVLPDQKIIGNPGKSI